MKTVARGSDKIPDAAVCALPKLNASCGAIITGTYRLPRRDAQRRVLFVYTLLYQVL